ncbi:hypothetical protein D3C71_344310 [compost metagenome]
MVKESKKIRIIITAYLICVLLSTFMPIASRKNLINVDYITASVWFDVFWACYKNLTICLLAYFIFIQYKISNTDKRFLIITILVNVSQCLMYCICPLAEQSVIDWFFMSFCVMIMIILPIMWFD